MRLVFMGTPDFSVPVLEKLVEAGHQVIGVVTQEDKPKGRGKEIQYTPVKAKALELGIEVYQPHRVKTPEFTQVLRDMNPDAMVVVAFGQILSKEILDIPRYGCINIHASLLPTLRGAAPIQWSIINGEAITGVTTMQMDVGLDTGDMLERIEIPIEAEETGGSLHDKLSAAGAELIISTLDKLENGTAVRTKQDDSKSSYAKMLDKKLGNIDFNQEAEYIERLIRGLNPWPSAYTTMNGKLLKLWKAKVRRGIFKETPGTVINIAEGYFTIVCGADAIDVYELQLEGKRRMGIDEFLRGNNVTDGIILG